MKQPKKQTKIPYNHNDIKAGSVIMRAGTVTPERMELESEDFCDGWDRVRNYEAGPLDKSLRAAGWRLCFIAESLQAVAVGTYDQDTVQRAIITLLGKLGPQMFNCVEVTEIAYKDFVGVPYVHVVGHARHIQREVELDSFVSRRNEIHRTAIVADHSERKAAHVTA
jgi:hypothetical protein